MWESDELLCKTNGFCPLGGIRATLYTTLKLVKVRYASVLGSDRWPLRLERIVTRAEGTAGGNDY